MFELRTFDPRRIPQPRTENRLGAEGAEVDRVPSPATWLGMFPARRDRARLLDRGPFPTARSDRVAWPSRGVPQVGAAGRTQTKRRGP
jgi:hypothetical protein